MIKCCIFDLDGTILDTLDSITYFVNRTLEKNGIPQISKEDCRMFVGNGATKLIFRALEYRGITDEKEKLRILGEYISEYDSDATYLTNIFPGVEELLASLKSKGIKLAVLSNKQDSSTKSAVEHFFPNTFDVVKGGTDTEPLKPNPDVSLKIAKMFSLEPYEVAWIGDTSVDVETGKNMKAGLTIAVDWGLRPVSEAIEAGADKIVSNTEQILSEVLCH